MSGGYGVAWDCATEHAHARLSAHTRYTHGFTCLHTHINPLTQPHEDSPLEQ